MSEPILITYNGETHTITQWSRITGIPDRTIYSRYVSGVMSIEEVLFTPVNYKTLIVTDPETGESHTIKEWSEITGIKVDTLYYRIFVYKKGIHFSLTEPVRPKPQIEYNGETLNVHRLNTLLGFPSDYLNRQHKKGADLYKVIDDMMKNPNYMKNAIYFSDEYGTFTEKEWDKHLDSLV